MTILVLRLFSLPLLHCRGAAAAAVAAAAAATASASRYLPLFHACPSLSSLFCLLGGLSAAGFFFYIFSSADTAAAASSCSCYPFLHLSTLVLFASLLARFLRLCCWRSLVSSSFFTHARAWWRPFRFSVPTSSSYSLSPCQS